MGGQIQSNAKLEATAMSRLRTGTVVRASSLNGSGSRGAALRVKKEWSGQSKWDILFRSTDSEVENILLPKNSSVVNRVQTLSENLLRVHLLCVPSRYKRTLQAGIKAEDTPVLTTKVEHMVRRRWRTQLEVADRNIFGLDDKSTGARATRSRTSDAATKTPRRGLGQAGSKAFPTAVGLHAKVEMRVTTLSFTHRHTCLLGLRVVESPKESRHSELQSPIVLHTACPDIVIVGRFPLMPRAWSTYLSSS
nr:hypothetical protein Iba_chr13aCG7340 [Ipomoea batatas]